MESEVQSYKIPRSNPLVAPFFSVMNHSVLQRLFKVQLRVFAIALLPPRESEIIRDGIRGAKFVMIDAAAHLSNYEQPDAFSRVVKEFIKVVSVKAYRDPIDSFEPISASTIHHPKFLLRLS